MKKQVLYKVGLVVLVVLVAAGLAHFYVPEAKADDGNAAIVYFSGTGTTKAFAERIQANTGGKLVEIKAAEPYAAKDLDWSDSDSRVTKEHESADSPAESTVRPKIKNLKKIQKAVKNADTVYIGYPIWWGEAPHIVYNLVENVDLSGKTVVPFCTSMSSGIGDSAKNLKKNAKTDASTKWQKGKNYYNEPTQEQVDKWLKKIK